MNDDLPEEIAADLPPPRSDEPTSLRQDIIDELADHLTCSVQREQFRDGAAGQSESQLWQRVLQRFGSPGGVARRLWFDWMWEKIVMQRVTMFLMVAMVASTIAMFVTMNQSLQASRESQTMLMKELLAMKESKPTAIAPSQPSLWNNLKVKVVFDDEYKTPVADAQVIVTGVTERTKSIPPKNTFTNSTGVADCGVVLYGEYNVDIRLTKGTKRMFVKGHRAIVYPDQDGFLEIVVPATLDREVKFHLDLGHAGKNLEFDESRIWCLNRKYNRSPTAKTHEDGTTVSWLSGSTEAKGLFDIRLGTTQGSIPFSSLEPVDSQERFEGLLDAKDERVHRFSPHRLLIPEGVLLKDSVPLGYGKYTHESNNIGLYLEMKLTDGRRILTRIPDLYAPSFFNPQRRIPNTVYKSEFEAFQRMIEERQDWRYYTSVFRGKPSGSSDLIPSGRQGSSRVPGNPVSRVSVYNFLAFYLTGGPTPSGQPGFSVIPRIGEDSQEPVEVQIHPSQQYLATLNFLANIPTDLVLVAATLSMSNDAPSWRSQKFDLFLASQKNKEEVLIAQEIAILSALPNQPGGGGEGVFVSPEGHPNISKAFCLIGIKMQNFATAYQSLMKAADQDAGNFKLLTLTAKPSKSDAPESGANSGEKKTE